MSDIIKSLKRASQHKWHNDTHTHTSVTEVYIRPFCFQSCLSHQSHSLGKMAKSYSRRLSSNSEGRNRRTSTHSLRSAQHNYNNIRRLQILAFCASKYLKVIFKAICMRYKVSFDHESVGCNDRSSFHRCM